MSLVDLMSSKAGLALGAIVTAALPTFNRIGQDAATVILQGLLTPAGAADAAVQLRRAATPAEWASYVQVVSRGALQAAQEAYDDTEFLRKLALQLMLSGLSLVAL